MRSIRLQNINKSYAHELVLENFTLTIPSGKFFALLGPSGCGKTTILRMIAGFETVDSGSIFLENIDITHMPVYKRSINTVFQSYALFPHLNVYENIAYSQRIRGVPSAIIKQRVERVLRIVHLEPFANKAIQQLSGGQKQRVALARAIINEPDVLLLDEPLTALDPVLREKMLLELIDLQSNLQTTFVYVTHDHFEALAVADQLAILNHEGHIEQVGTAYEIYEFPVSKFVAQFVGTTNLFTGTVHSYSGETAILDVPGVGLLYVHNSANREKMPIGITAFMSVRPEKIIITKQKKHENGNVLEGTVQGIIYLGRSTQYNVRLKSGYIVTVFEQNDEHLNKEAIDYDDTVYLFWYEKNAILLDH